MKKGMWVRLELFACARHPLCGCRWRTAGLVRASGLSRDEKEMWVRLELFACAKQAAEDDPERREERDPDPDSAPRVEDRVGDRDQANEDEDRGQRPER